MLDVSEKRSFSILIVDDEYKNIQILYDILCQKERQVEYVFSGAEALEIVENKKFDMILLDVMMPVMDGYEVCKNLKENIETRDIPIIFLTAKSDTEDMVKAFEIGAVDYVIKPFNSMELKARVNTHLELKRSRDLFKKMAITDGLTKLYNHSHINERLAQEISRAKRHSQPLSLFMFDLDHFKKINDTYGHKTGDEVLVRISSLLSSILRKEDIAGRYGGEEFIVILPNTDEKSGLNVAEKVRRDINNIKWSIQNLQVTISGGISSLEKEDVKEFLVKVDKLLYAAKNSGRNRIEGSF